MKKKILFVVTNLGTGGILRSLQNFLNRFDTSSYEIDVFALVHYGLYKNDVNALSNCNVLPRNMMLDASVAQFENQKGLAKAESLILKLMDKATHYRPQRYLLRKAGENILRKKEYDAVIGFSEGLPTLFVSMMDHPNKIGWIHCDYSSYFQLNGCKSELSIYDKLNHVVCVSDFTCHSFSKIYPSLKGKTTFIYNILDDAMMKERAKETIEETFDKLCFNIVSVGRIDPVKRLTIVPELARSIIDAGCTIRWYVIGPKGSYDELAIFNNNIAKYNVAGVVIPLGEKSNPYPYIDSADLLVNTSVSEACPYVINEAKILGTPVVCTDFGSAKEFITNGKDGYSVAIEKMADCIVRLINAPKEIKQMRTSLASFHYDNEHILKQIYSLI